MINNTSTYMVVGFQTRAVAAAEEQQTQEQQLLLPHCIGCPCFLPSFLPLSITQSHILTSSCTHVNKQEREKWSKKVEKKGVCA